MKLNIKIKTKNKHIFYFNLNSHYKLNVHKQAVKYKLVSYYKYSTATCIK